MSDDEFSGRQKLTAGLRPPRAVPYTARDFQLEILGQLAEMQALTQALQESLTEELKKHRDESKLLRFDGRTLVAVGAIALSLTGYVLQDARNTTKRDADIEASKARVSALERVSEVNTEGRIKTEVELNNLRQGQVEIKASMQVHERASKKTLEQK
jgi:hypothetical protein